MSRSIGDYAVKSVGVIPDPETFRFEIEEKDKFMILGILMFVCGCVSCRLMYLYGWIDNYIYRYVYYMDSGIS
jgi:hypothetical protein